MPKKRKPYKQQEDRVLKHLSLQDRRKQLRYRRMIADDTTFATV